MSFAPVVFIPAGPVNVRSVAFWRQAHQVADCWENGAVPCIQDEKILCNPTGKAERSRYQSQFYRAVNPNVTGKKPQQNASNYQDDGLGSERSEEASELEIQCPAQRGDLPGQHREASHGLAENQ
jgi:hypothetical protein